MILLPEIQITNFREVEKYIFIFSTLLSPRTNYR
jgi:hypothetical protein